MRNARGTSSPWIVLAVSLAIAPLSAALAVDTASDVKAEEVAVEAANEHGPRIEFESRVHEFGEAMSGAILETSFSFRNVGEEVLHIQKVSGG